MKANKALKRLSKIEALLSDVTERYSASGPHIRELLRDAKAAVIRAKKAVQASSGTATNPPVKHSQPLSKTAPEPSKPKPTLSAAGRKAISDATKKRWAAKKAAAAKVAPAIAKKATAKKAVAKKPTPVKAAKPPIRKVARKAPAKKAAVKAQSKKAVRVVQAANPTPAPPKIEDAAVTTPEQVVPETPVQ
jgi:colicin import membrane protein